MDEESILLRVPPHLWSSINQITTLLYSCDCSRSRYGVRYSLMAVMVSKYKTSKLAAYVLFVFRDLFLVPNK